MVELKSNSSELVQALREVHPGSTLAVRDVLCTTHPPLDELALQALFTSSGWRPEQRRC